MKLSTKYILTIFIFIFLSLQNIKSQNIHSREIKSKFSLFSSLPKRTIAVVDCPNVNKAKKALALSHLYKLSTEKELQLFLSPFTKLIPPYIKRWLNGIRENSFYTILSHILTHATGEITLAIVDINTKNRKNKIGAIAGVEITHRDTLLQFLKERGIQFTKSGSSDYKVTLNETLHIHIINNFILVSTQENIIHEIIANHKNKKSWHYFKRKKLYDKVLVKEEICIVRNYINFDATIKYFPSIKSSLSHIQKKTGIGNIKSLIMTSNIAGKNMHGYFFLQTRGKKIITHTSKQEEKTNIIKLASRVPAHTSIFNAINLDIFSFFSKIEKFISSIDTNEEKKSLMKNLEKKLGINIKTDLATAFGSQMYSTSFSPGEGLLSETVFVLPLKNRNMVKKCVKSFAEFFQLEIKNLICEKKRIHYFVTPIGKWKNPFRKLKEIEPFKAIKVMISNNLSGYSFMYHGNSFYIATSSQILRSYLIWKKTNKLHLLGVKDFTNNIDKTQNYIFINHVDMRKTIKGWWSTLRIILRKFEGYLRSIGIPLETALLPRSETIAKHLGLNTITISIQKDGIFITSKGFIDAVSVLGGIAGVTGMGTVFSMSLFAERGKIIGCKANLDRMGKGLALFIGDYGRNQYYYPAHKVKFITVLYKVKLITETTVYVSPGTGHETSHEALMMDYPNCTDYEASEIPIFRPYRNRDTTPLIWTKFGVHIGKRNVLYLDGHTETLTEYKFQQLMKKQKEIAKKYKKEIREAQEKFIKYYSQNGLWKKERKKSVIVTSKAQRIALLIQCKENLLAMGKGMQIFVYKYGRSRYYPPAHKIQFITVLYKANILRNKNIFVSPASGHTTSHKALMGDEENCTDYEATNLAIFRPHSQENITPIIWTKIGIHPGCRNVLFLDGHVETLSEPHFQKMMKKQGSIRYKYSKAILRMQRKLYAMHGNAYYWKSSK